jgi:DNA-binding beta-propeller fold protein YncE
VIPVISIIAAFAGNSTSAGAQKSNFDPATWKPTQEQPLPTMESPITFQLTDDGGYWFDNRREDLEGTLHTRSLVAGVGPTTVKFSIKEPFTSEAHVVDSIIWPEGAKNMPFEQPGGVTGDLTVDLVTPGLYAFQCVIHPYMLGAAVIDDPSTPGADFGPKLRWIDGTIMPSASHEILSIVRSFFILTEPSNWQNYAADKDTTWDPKYPAAPILTHNQDGSPNLIPNLDEHYQKMFKEPITLKAPVKPAEPGVGTAYAMTQWEMSAGKTKPGSITAWDTETWKMQSKWFGPSVNLNNPHNVWTDLEGKLMYSTNWFSNRLTVLDRSNGAVLRELEVGPSPSHVITRPNNDNVIIPNNGGGRIVEVDPGGNKIIRTYLTQAPGERPAFPHGHWVSGDGKYIVTPNSNETGASIVNMDMRSMVKPKTGLHPVAASFTNDSTRAYVANLLDHTIVCVSVEEPACRTPNGGVQRTYTIDLRADYNKVTGESTGPYGLSPIQLPNSPDDNYMLSVGTFTANILVIDLKTNKLVKTLPCGPGCHGINFGAKKGGGYYGYVTIKFANKFIVVDGDPNGDGDPSDAKIAGSLLTDAEPGIQMDDKPTRNIGQGGNGVFVYPIAYNGWVQKMPDVWKAKLTCQQRAPLSKALC